MVREILVVKREVLFGDGEFEGVIGLDNKDYIKIILDNYEWRERNDELEHDNTYQQPIPYIWIINKKEGKVFMYKRSVSGNEKRLHNRYSGGVGGHIDKDTEEKSSNPILSAMMRELKEEVIMEEYIVPKIIGYINLKGGVEDVHFGVMGIIDTVQDVKPAEDMSEGKFYSIEEADALFVNGENQFDKWTEVGWPVIKNYILKDNNTL